MGVKQKMRRIAAPGLHPSFFILFLWIRFRPALVFFVARDGETILFAQPGMEIVRPAMLAAKWQRAPPAGIKYLAALGAPRQRHPHLPEPGNSSV
jgi:hypothetical protein